MESLENASAVVSAAVKAVKIDSPVRPDHPEVRAAASASGLPVAQHVILILSALLLSSLCVRRHVVRLLSRGRLATFNASTSRRTPSTLMQLMPLQCSQRMPRRHHSASGVHGNIS